MTTTIKHKDIAIINIVDVYKHRQLAFVGILPAFLVDIMSAV